MEKHPLYYVRFERGTYVCAACLPKVKQRMKEGGLAHNVSVEGVIEDTCCSECRCENLITMDKFFEIDKEKALQIMEMLKVGERRGNQEKE